jgi:hypothetical protein
MIPPCGTGRKSGLPRCNRRNSCEALKRCAGRWRWRELNRGQRVFQPAAILMFTWPARSPRKSLQRQLVHACSFSRIVFRAFGNRVGDAAASCTCWSSRIPIYRGPAAGLRPPSSTFNGGNETRSRSKGPEGTLGLCPLPSLVYPALAGLFLVAISYATAASGRGVIASISAW